ncbi:MAG: 3-methyl-2-oxobutanoate hydroxymethyltransferase, partial [Bacteriovoracaceae bacterium]
MKKRNTRTIKTFKKKEQGRFLQMLTCYDFQTASLLNETELDMILVGDSLGNVVLGYSTTVSVTVNEMNIFGAAVKRGAPKKFVIVDMPFGSYNSVEEGLKNATEIFQRTQAEALKLEGAFPYQLELIERLTQVGIPVMGHIGLTPQSVHQQGGY